MRDWPRVARVQSVRLWLRLTEIQQGLGLDDVLVAWHVVCVADSADILEVVRHRVIVARLESRSDFLGELGVDIEDEVCQIDVVQNVMVDDRRGLLDGEEQDVEPVLHGVGRLVVAHNVLHQLARHIECVYGGRCRLHVVQQIAVRVVGRVVVRRSHKRFDEAVDQQRVGHAVFVEHATPLGDIAVVVAHVLDDQSHLEQHLVIDVRLAFRLKLLRYAIVTDALQRVQEVHRSLAHHQNGQHVL
mmetsp:Transcript_20308/g.32268  ORF Transcript_20308/g.32268 Transcript_20308/m.32268 type:complete len:244 (-) Transcript_20308:105-836(-)